MEGFRYYAVIVSVQAASSAPIASNLTLTVANALYVDPAGASGVCPAELRHSLQLARVTEPDACAVRPRGRAAKGRRTIPPRYVLGLLPCLRQRHWSRAGAPHSRLRNAARRSCCSPSLTHTRSLAGHLQPFWRGLPAHRGVAEHHDRALAHRTGSPRCLAGACHCRHGGCSPAACVGGPERPDLRVGRVWGLCANASCWQPAAACEVGLDRGGCCIGYTRACSPAREEWTCRVGALAGLGTLWSISTPSGSLCPPPPGCSQSSLSDVFTRCGACSGTMCAASLSGIVREGPVGSANTYQVLNI